MDYVSQLVDEKYAGLLKKRRGRRRLHDARPAPAAAGAGSARRRHGAGGQAAGRAQAPRAGAGRARRRRPAYGRDSRAGRRPRVQPVAIQSRRRRPAAAGFGLQAVRLSGGVRSDGRGRARGPHAGDRSSSTSRRSSRTARTTTRRQLPERVRRPDHPAPCARPLAQHRRRSRSPKPIGYDRVAALWKRDECRRAGQGVPVDRAGRLRSLAGRNGRGLHAVHERRLRPAASGAHADRRERQATSDRRPRRQSLGRASPTSPTSSRT